MSSKIEQIAREIAKANQRTPSQIKKDNDEGKKGVSELLKDLEKAVKDSEEDTDIIKAYRTAAMEHYASDDIEIDEDACVSIGEDGAFVAAWVFVAKEGD